MPAFFVRFLRRTCLRNHQNTKRGAQVFFRSPPKKTGSVALMLFDEETALHGVVRPPAIFGALTAMTRVLLVIRLQAVPLPRGTITIVFQTLLGI